MSTYYAENNNEGAKKLFYKRRIYNTDSTNASFTNLEDFRAEKRLYGRVNRRFVPMVHPPRSGRLKAFPQAVNPQERVEALDFVVDAFNDLAQQFRKCAMTGKIDTTDKYLTNLVVHRAMLSPQTKYKISYNMWADAFHGTAKGGSTQIENFDMMAQQLLGAIGRGGLRRPFTFPAYVKSRRCPILVSGLAIEIADLDASNDDEKVNTFLNSNNWEFFLNACRTYGFMVDKEVPWRLVADIGSSPMIEYAAKYGANSTDRILNTYYGTAFVPYYTTFAQRLLNLYNRVKPRKIQYLEECGGKTILRRRDPQHYNSVDLLLSEYGSDYFITLYCQMRFAEEESQFTDNEKRLLIDDVLELSHLHSERTALNKFEIFLNKPFDYEGSLSYYSIKKKVKEGELGASPGITSGY